LTHLPPWNEMALVGRIARAHGNKGQVIVNPETDFPELRFAPGSLLYRQREDRVEALSVATLRFHRGRPIVGFEGVDSMDDAEQMAGAELRVPENALQPLPEGTFYVHQLKGCRVETGKGEEVGVVERVEGKAGAAHLVIASPSGEVLIPLAAQICTVIDVAGRRIIVEPPEGLLDLNPRRGRD
jgi:16S rRNA processing protein RimM